jgi:hypothetical protein
MDGPMWQHLKTLKNKTMKYLSKLSLPKWHKRELVSLPLKNRIFVH